MVENKSKDAVDEEFEEIEDTGKKRKKGKRKKKEKKPKLTPEEKAIKNKDKVEKSASAKVKKAEAKVKKAEQAAKNKEKAALKKEKDKERKAEKKIKDQEKKIIDKQKKKEDKSVKKVQKKERNREKKAEKRAEKLQRRAELAARTPIQRKVDRQRHFKKFLLVLLAIALAAAVVFAGIKFGPELIKKIDLPEINISEKIDAVKSKIPFLNKEKEEPEEEEEPEENQEENPEEEPEAPDDATLYISGSSVLEPFYSEALKEFLKLDKAQLKEQSVISDTNTSYTNLINGDEQVIFASFPTDKETRMAAMAGVDLQPIPILNGGFVFFVNKDNPVKNLTMTQIYNIYAGNITNWNQVGGKNQPITAYQRTANSGSQSGMYKHVISEDEIMKVSDDMKISETKDIAKAVAGDESAIGYSYYYYMEKLKDSGNVKMISVNSVVPNTNTISTAEYPLTTYTYAVIATEEASMSLSDVIKRVDNQVDAMNNGESAETGTETGTEAETGEPEKQPLKMEFIKWILSEEGQSLAEEKGFIRHNDQ